MNKKCIYKGMAMLALLAATSSCEKDTLPTNLAPNVVTGSTDGIYRTGVTSIEGRIDNPNGYTVEEYGIQYSQFQSFAEPEEIKATQMDTKGNFTVSVEGLEPGEGYYYRAYAFSGHNTIYGEARPFTTVTTSAPQFDDYTTVTNVGLTSFDVATTLLDDGGDEGGIQMSAFLYMPVDEEVGELLMTTTGVLIKNVNVNDFRATLTELYTGTLYAVRPMAVTGSGVGYGKIAHVTTVATENTLLSSIVFSDTTLNTINVEANILASGTHPIVETGFCYTTENSEPTIQNLTVQAEQEGTAFKATLTELNAATTYYIRAYAKDDQGTVSYSETAVYKVAAHQDLVVVTNNADEISAITARLWGKISNNNVQVRERGICWSKTKFQPVEKQIVANATYAVVEVVDSVWERYSYTLDVDFNTTYYFCAYGKNSKGEAYYGDLLEFTTPDINEPTLAMNEATEITDSTAIVSAAFSLNYEYRANYGVKCGLLLSVGNAEPTLEDHDTQLVCDVVLEEHLTSEIIEVPFSGKFRSLAPNTKYYYRAYAENEKGLVYSEVKSFTSLKLTPTPDDAGFPEVKQ